MISSEFGKMTDEDLKTLNGLLKTQEKAERRAKRKAFLLSVFKPFIWVFCKLFPKKEEEIIDLGAGKTEKFRVKRSMSLNSKGQRVIKKEFIDNDGVSYYDYDYENDINELAEEVAGVKADAADLTTFPVELQERIKKLNLTNLSSLTIKRKIDGTYDLIQDERGTQKDVENFNKVLTTSLDENKNE